MKQLFSLSHFERVVGFTWLDIRMFINNPDLYNIKEHLKPEEKEFFYPKDTFKLAFRNIIHGGVYNLDEALHDYKFFDPVDYQKLKYMFKYFCETAKHLISPKNIVHKDFYVYNKVQLKNNVPGKEFVSLKGHFDYYLKTGTLVFSEVVEDLSTFGVHFVNERLDIKIEVMRKIMNRSNYSANTVWILATETSPPFYTQCFNISKEFINMSCPSHRVDVPTAINEIIDVKKSRFSNDIEEAWVI